MTLSHRRISPKELRDNGWTPDPKPASRYMIGRSYTHRDGWHISHCGHPTAHWPYILRSPAGDMILTGAAFGNPRDYGTAWPTVASAVDYVATQKEKPCQHHPAGPKEHKPNCSTNTDTPTVPHSGLTLPAVYTGSMETTTTDKNQSAVRLGKLRAKTLTTEHQQAAIRARWGDRAMCSCGCGLTLERAKLRHPVRARLLHGLPVATATDGQPDVTA